MAKVGYLYDGRWKVNGELARHEWGGQAAIYIVTDEQGEFPGELVLKRFNNVNKIDRFRNEVAAMRTIDHPNVAKILHEQLDISDSSRKPYIIMPYYDAGNLTTIKDELKTDHALVLELFEQICSGLAQAHSVNIVHRDIKPENILLRTKRGPAIVTDFGICYFDDDLRDTATAEVKGSRFCTPLELQWGKVQRVFPYSDVYCLGKLLYWMLTGGGDFPQEHYRDRRADLVHITGNPRMEEVNLMLDNMVTPDVDKRFANAGSLLSVVRRAKLVLIEKYNVPTLKAPQQCRYCGKGYYGVAYRSDENGDNRQLMLRLGLPPEGAGVLVLECTICGNLQYFRVDLSARDQRARLWLGEPRF